MKLRFWAAFVALGILMLQGSAVAGNEKGNGGIVVTCSFNGSPSIDSIRLLDFYEAKVLREIDYDFGPGNLTMMDKVHYALNRLSRLDPARAQKYLEQADQFLANTRFIDSAILPDTNDYGFVPIPAGCTFQQLAVQRQPQFPEDKLYLINKLLWNALDADSAAGLILHEIVYGEALHLGQTTSVNARYLTSIISSAKVNSFSGVEYLQILKDVGFAGPINPPFGWVSDPIILENACAGSKYSSDLNRYIFGSVPGLKFQIGNDLPTWLNFEEGKLSGAPLPSDIGKASFAVGVLSGEVGAVTRVEISVIKCDVAQTVTLHAQADRALKVNVAALLFTTGATNTFSIVSGPSWLSITASGVVFGTPKAADVGTNYMQLQIRKPDGTTTQNKLVVFVAAP